MSTVSDINTEQLNKMDWEDILDTLEAQKCILFLGSGAFQVGENNLDQAIQQWLGLPDPEHPHVKLYNDDGFMLLRKNRYKRKVIASLHDFYSQAFPETELAFSQLARLPFNVIVTLTPDNLLARTFDNLGLEYLQDSYFKHRQAPATFTAPTAGKPLIYNLLGNIEEPESLVLTHQDFFAYMESMFTSNGMHEDLKLTLENAERYIFLGLPYERWYFQLLLRMLSMQDLKEVERLALQEFENPRLHELYTEEFKIDFVPTDIGAFLNRLFHECESSELLKDLPKPEHIVDEGLSSEQLQELVAQGKTEQAMQQLKLRLQASQPRSKELLTSLIVLRNRYKLLQQREMRGTIDSRDLSVENAQIVEELVGLIQQSDEL
ncbi:MAG: SIR2 family protein [Bacteroidota bacterium]